MVHGGNLRRPKVLDEPGFDAAYERGRALPRDDALALAAEAVTNPVVKAG